MENKPTLIYVTAVLAVFIHANLDLCALIM
jgi:hypothetical protein